MINVKGNYDYPGDMLKSVYDINNDGVVDAADAVPWSGVTDKPSTLAGYGISEVPANAITGVLSPANIPPQALERMKVVSNDTARFALTTADVQNGDTVKVVSSGMLYFVVDDTNLDSESGYEVYAAGRAAAVDWSGVESKPTTLSGYGITDAYAKADGEALEDDVDGLQDFTGKDAQAVEDKEPYTFRASKAGDRAYEKLIGGTVAWNQLVLTNKKSGAQTPDGSLKYSYINIIDLTLKKDHVYVISAKISYSGQKTLRAFCSVGEVYGRPPQNLSGSSDNFMWLLTVVNNAYGYALGLSNLLTSDNLTSEDAWSYDNAMVIDLTAMFGSAIADYAYSLEQATEGAGIAWLKTHFPQFFNSGYKAYDAGSLKSVNVVSKKTVGFNQWDEELELGAIGTSNGLLIDSTTMIRSKNKIPVLPNTKYCFRRTPSSLSSNAYYVVFYDENDNALQYIQQNPSDAYVTNKAAGILYSSNIVTFETPKNASYIRFRMDSQVTYNHDICINLSKTTGSPKNGDYLTYESHTYAFDSDVELRGIPKLDANNKLYYDGDVYESDGTVTRKYGIVDLGTLNWGYDENHSRFNSNAISDIKAPPNGDTLANAICSEYPIVIYNTMAATDKTLTVIWKSSTFEKQVWIHDTNYNNAVTFKSAMSGVYLVYELATPTSEEADPFQSPMIVDADGTEEFVDTRNVQVPVGHETRYLPKSLSTDVDEINGHLFVRENAVDSHIANILGNFASIEQPTAMSNHAVGDYIVVGDKLYKVTAAITSGESLVVGTNISATTIGTELSAIWTAINS